MAYSSGGGSGIAALRLHRALLEQGVESHFLYHLHHKPNHPNVHHYPVRRFSLLERVLIHLGPYTISQRNARLIEAAGCDFDLFTFATSDDLVHLNEHVRDCDVINLHGVGGWLDYPSFFRSVRKPIVWTLHDRNPFRGGFHYEADEVRNKESMGEVDQRILDLKIESYGGSTIRAVVSPSRWLCEEARASRALGDFPNFHVPNSINTDVFQPYDPAYSRKVLGLPADRRILLYVSADVGTYRKGFDLLLGAIAGIPETTNVQWVAIGNSPAECDPRIRYLGAVKDERVLAMAYSAADAFVLPSREDNLPNVMLESLCCGTPCIGTPVGGIKDAVRDGLNGILARSVDSPAIEAAIRRFLSEGVQMNRSEISHAAVEQYALGVQGARYRAIYDRVMKCS